MFIQAVKAGAAVALFLANVPLAAAQIQASDLAAGNQAQYQTVTYQAAQQSVETTAVNSKSGKQMSPVPELGTMAMLITGICLVGVAARRQSVAA
ncbi:hypothetical protein L6Q21_03085 [Sandaracinobacter sp. RS1-74]|uniref:hypothetical protein n=1 Tax=Sandaracinobacteroides sayramensis TaxID=2913411 RepID=UPI001EDA1A2E|nr:hypothetical protein [Sandaracinobacteroides sayramensis]MCG2839966.1 hypothetical protein [Sandaracinobacteroides sayramensis]